MNLYTARIASTGIYCTVADGR